MKLDPATLRERVTAVVIGTSAGGIEALSVVLPALPGDLRAAVLIVVHLPEEEPSLLVNLFAPRCALPVREASDKEPVEGSTVYFAPPGYHLLIDAGPAFSLSVDEAVHFSRPSIDVLFESAAAVYRSHLLGIILTGASEDGAAGLEAVRRAGGLAWVQAPETASAPLMPAAAARRAPVDEELTLGQLAERLQKMGGGEARR